MDNRPDSELNVAEICIKYNGQKVEYMNTVKRYIVIRRMMDWYKIPFYVVWDLVNKKYSHPQKRERRKFFDECMDDFGVDWNYNAIGQFHNLFDGDMIELEAYKLYNYG